MRKLLTSTILLVLTLVAKAEVKMPKIFGDNMVLQQQTDCHLWGTADAGKQVKVRTSWDGRTYKTQADAQGKWRVSVRTPQAGGPYDITLTDGKMLTLHDVLIGEVWICSGQSNMEMPMKGFMSQPVEGTANELMTCKDDRLRLFTVKRNAQLHPVDDVEGSWSKAQSESVRDFSAAAYYFGKSLRKSLGVPVGLVLTAWGGSALEAWLSADWMKPEWMARFPHLHSPLTQEDVDKSKQRCPTAMYNGQLHPIVGYTMRGVIWYQGEDNCKRYMYYTDQMEALVGGWRKEWKQGNFPFYYCQIAPYEYDRITKNTISQLLREKQMETEKRIDNCRMAVLMDIGLEYGIHPRKKAEVGNRLALLALKGTYGMKGLPDYATYKAVTMQGDTAVVTFDHCQAGIYFENGPESDNFEIAGEDKVFHKAKAWISRNKVFVKCDEVKNPVAVRYAWRNWAKGDLFHGGLPVSSFRTDRWEVVAP